MTEYDKRIRFETTSSVAATTSLKSASMSGAEDDPLSQWFAIPAFFVIFRETLEATVMRRNDGLTPCCIFLLTY